jgi:cystathionine beta-lyase/cystathionine gamma-synthase
MDISYILNHLGEERELYFGAVAPPVIQSSNFAFKTVDELRQSFVNERNVHLYTRGNNPTVEILRKKVAALAGAEDALVFGSGAAAVAAAVMSVLKAGDHVVCVKKPYSWTNRLLNDYLSRFNVSVTMVDGTDPQNFVTASNASTKLWMLESPNSFTLELQDLGAIARLAKERKIVTVVDNSYCTSLGQRCIEMGIDIEVHSATKYYGGHSDVVAGFLIGSRAMLDKIFATELLNMGGYHFSARCCFIAAKYTDITHTHAKDTRHHRSGGCFYEVSSTGGAGDLSLRGIVRAIYAGKETDALVRWFVFGCYQSKVGG